MSVTTSSNAVAREESDDRHALIEKVRHLSAPIARVIGFHVEDITRGRAVASLHSGPRHANPLGTLHGGVLCDLTDAPMGRLSSRRWRPTNFSRRPA
jgi:acyl-coenzyme A thioesterase PaaI-like protein